MTTETKSRPLFAARLPPHPSMSPRGVKIVCALAASLLLIPGLLFYLLGAWPVVGFMGLDVAALYWALTWSLRDGRQSEQVTLLPDRLGLSRLRRAHHRDPAQDAAGRGARRRLPQPARQGEFRQGLWRGVEEGPRRLG